MDSFAPSTTNVCWTCVVILPLNTTTWMTYFVFSWPLDWKTIKTTSALLSDWIRGKEQLSLASFRWCLGYQVTAANHFPTPEESDPEHELSTGNPVSLTQGPNCLLILAPKCEVHPPTSCASPIRYCNPCFGIFFLVVLNPVGNDFSFHLVFCLFHHECSLQEGGTRVPPPPQSPMHSHSSGAKNTG